MTADAQTSMRFDHVTPGQRVLFGAGRAAELLAAEVARLHAQRIMLIEDNRDAAAAITARIDVAVHHDEVAPHVPVDRAEHARAVAGANDIDLLVCIGGGSATGLAKAVALTSRLPIIAIPTTYAGSEATNVWGITDASGKKTGVDDAVLPGTIIYDAELTMSLPKGLSVASGLNALAHCVDAMWAPRADPINAALATAGIRALAQGLPDISRDPGNLGGRERVLIGAYLSAAAFSSAGSGMHHKICHVLGGAYDMPHAQTHAVVLPYVLAYNAPAAPRAAADIAEAFGARTAIDGLQKLRMELNAPRALKDFGLPAEEIAHAAELILPFIPPSNPRAVTVDDLEQLLNAAYAGVDPTHYNS